MSDKEILHIIREKAKAVLPEGSRLYLYGSRARGDAHEGSDWDLLILLNRPQDENQDFRRISYPIMQVGFDLDQYFSVHTYSKAEWDAISFLPFYKNVEHDKIILI